MAPDEWLRDTAGGVSLLVKVIPRAGSTKIAGIRDGRLLVRLAAAPVDDAANEALIVLLATSLKIPAWTISVAGGAHSRNKQLLISGVSAGRVLSLLGPQTPP